MASIESCLKFFHELKTVLNDVDYKKFLMLIKNINNLEVMEKVLTMLKPHRAQLDLLDQILFSFGPSYHQRRCRLEAPDHEVLNTTLQMIKPRKTEFQMITPNNRHEEAMFECEDEQYKTDFRIEMLRSVIRDLESHGRSFKGIEARLVMSLECSEEDVGKFLKRPDQDSVLLKLLQDCLKKLIGIRSENSKIWARVYQQHHPKALAYCSTVPVIRLTEKEFVQEIRSIHETNRQITNHDLHPSVFSELWRPDMVFVFQDQLIHEDISTLVMKVKDVRKVWGIWGFFLEHVVGVGVLSWSSEFASPIDCNLQAPPIATYFGDRKSQQDAKDVFFGSVQFYVLLRLYSRMYERMNKAKLTCRTLKKEFLYQNFITGILEAGDDDDCSSLSTMNQLLALIIKQLKLIERDQKSVDAIALYKRDVVDVGIRDNRVYYANARFAIFLEQEMYRIESLKPGDGVEVMVRISDEDNGFGDLNSWRSLCDRFATGDWIQDVVMETSKDDEQRVFETNPPFRRTMVSKRKDREEQPRAYHLYNGLITRVTAAGERGGAVHSTEDVFYRFNRKRSRRRPVPFLQKMSEKF